MQSYIFNDFIFQTLNDSFLIFYFEYKFFYQLNNIFFYSYFTLHLNTFYHIYVLIFHLCTYFSFNESNQKSNQISTCNILTAPLTSNETVPKICNSDNCCLFISEMELTDEEKKMKNQNCLDGY